MSNFHLALLGTSYFSFISQFNNSSFRYRCSSLSVATCAVSLPSVSIVTSPSLWGIFYSSAINNYASTRSLKVSQINLIFNPVIVQQFSHLFRQIKLLPKMWFLRQTFAPRHWKSEDLKWYLSHDLLLCVTSVYSAALSVFLSPDPGYRWGRLAPNSNSSLLDEVSHHLYTHWNVWYLSIDE